MQRLTVTHVTRWQKSYNMVGFGHVYQGRFKSFPVETDDYFYQVNRYAERNALPANVVKRAYNNVEIADELGVVERTIRRKVNLIMDEWESTVE